MTGTPLDLTPFGSLITGIGWLNPGQRLNGSTATMQRVDASNEQLWRDAA